MKLSNQWLIKKGVLKMKFDYKDITLGDLDIELNYRNFEILCDGDNHTVRVGMIEDEENNSER